MLVVNAPKRLLFRIIRRSAITNIEKFKPKNHNDTQIKIVFPRNGDYFRMYY